MDSCRHYVLTVKAVGADGEDININALHSLNVYMFKDNKYVGVVPVQPDGAFQLGYDKGASLTFVAWANLKSDSLNIPKIEFGTNMEDALIKLKTGSGYDLSSSDLFYARKDFLATRTVTSQDDTATLVLKRSVSSITVTTKHLVEYFGNSSYYRYEIRGTRNSLNFLNEQIGTDAIFSPISYFDVNRQFVTPVFYVFPSKDNQQISVDIYRGETRIFTTNTDMYGTPLKAVVGKQVNVLIDFRSASITFSVNPWMSSMQNVDF
jgi:hypothetical protein